MPMQATMSNQYDWDEYTKMLYIKQIILWIIKQMDLSERAEIKQISRRQQKINTVNMGCSFLALFIWQTPRCANL